MWLNIKCLCHIRRSESKSIFGTNDVICRVIWPHLSFRPYQFSIFGDVGGWQPSSSQSGNMSFKVMSESWRRKWHHGFFYFKCGGHRWRLHSRSPFDYRTSHQFYNLTLGKVVFFLANFGAFVQCFRTSING